MSENSDIAGQALDHARERGIFSSLDVQFATRICELFGESSPELAWGLALACRQEARGHVCADLPELESRGLVAEVEGESKIHPALPEGFGLDVWLDRLRASRLVGVASSGETDGLEGMPLVLDEKGRLYLARSFRHQASLAQQIRRRSRAADLAVDWCLAEAGMERLAPRAERSASTNGTEVEPDWARLALRAGLARPFSVITGGPGTGKTTLVARLIALVIEQAVELGERLPVVRLLAPTGKAAAAMTGSFGRQRDRLDVSDEVRAALPTNAQTIHRLLLRQSRRDAFGRVRLLPIDADIVLVDEASMVDLERMYELFSVSESAARVVLLGDPDQLASVDSGAVLAEICSVVPANSGSTAAAAAETGSRRLSDSVVRLQENHRFASGGGIGRLAEAIRSGDVGTVFSLLEDPDLPEISRADVDSGSRVRRQLIESVRQMQAEIEATDSLEEKLAQLASWRVLCAHRSGPLGVEALCAALDEVAADSRNTASRSGWWRGRLLLVTRNAPEQELWNGDVGLVEDTERGLRALFSDGKGGVRMLSAGRLPSFESAVAMSVHKSQGSEFERVDLVLGNSSSRLMTRELIYTGVTRARERLCIHASEAVIRDALARRVQRDSALGELLTEEGH